MFLFSTIWKWLCHNKSLELPTLSATYSMRNLFWPPERTLACLIAFIYRKVGSIWTFFGHRRNSIKPDGSRFHSFWRILLNQTCTISQIFVIFPGCQLPDENPSFNNFYSPKSKRSIFISVPQIFVLNENKTIMKYFLCTVCSRPDLFLEANISWWKSTLLVWNLLLRTLVACPQMKSQ